MLKIRQFQPYLALICLLIIALATMIFFDRPLIRGDGVAYLAWLDTIALDLDIDLGNQVERLAPVNTYQVVWNDTTERWVIIFPFGFTMFTSGATVPIGVFEEFRAGVFTFDFSICAIAVLRLL